MGPHQETAPSRNNQACLKHKNGNVRAALILETVGNTATDDELNALESRWREKLQSREMGLNANYGSEGSLGVTTLR
jgi:hypothetical protein